jgi:hypothetical protein
MNDKNHEERPHGAHLVPEISTFVGACLPHHDVRKRIEKGNDTAQHEELVQQALSIEGID